MKTEEQILKQVETDFYPYQQSVIMEQIQDEPEAYTLKVTKKEPCRIYKRGLYVGRVENVISDNGREIMVSAKFVPFEKNA